MSQAELEPAALPPALATPALVSPRGEPRLNKALTVFVVAALALLAGMVATVAEVRLLLLLVGTGLFVLAGSMSVGVVRHHWQQQSLLKAVGEFVAHDIWPSIVADGQGQITFINAAATERLHGRQSQTLTAAFNDMFANPGALLFRLQERARDAGLAREEVVTRRGHLRLSAHRISDHVFLWRIEDIADRAGAGRGADAMSLPVMTAGPTGTILFMNDAFRRLTGGRARSLNKVFHDLPLVSGRIHSVEGLDGPVECLVAALPASGGRQEIYLLPSLAAAPGPNTPQGWDAIEDLPVPLLKVAITGQILASNREARALLSLPFGGESRLSDVLEGLGRPIIDWLRDTADGRGPPGPQFLRGTGNQQDTHVQVSLNLAGPPGERHLIAVLNDVTELKSLELQFVQSQKMQAIGQLAGGVAHDFNNLLTAISGHCDLLLLRHDQGDQDYGDLIQIHQNANRAASLVRQLLAFSRKQNLMPEVIDLRDTLSDLTHLLNRLVGEKVTLTLNHDPALMHIRADKRQLEQVMMNLVVNARDAMPDGGEIRVETENVTLIDTVERDRATLLPGCYVVVKVVDEGTGIAPEKLPKIFEPFYTTKRPGEGTGLGLSTAYGIVKQTGGFIFADSELGKGTTFTLFFPSHERQLAPAAPAPDLSVLPSDGKVDGVVLLVEDEAPVRAFASRALRLRGYSVLEADSAEAALALLADPELVVDIFVTDVIMPGKDGPTWVREALAHRPNTKVVFVSGYAEDAFSEHQALIPNSVFLPKPFSLTELTTTVQKQLH